jgi:hypothetical protein
MFASPTRSGGSAHDPHQRASGSLSPRVTRARSDRGSDRPASATPTAIEALLAANPTYRPDCPLDQPPDRGSATPAPRRQWPSRSTTAPRLLVRPSGPRSLRHRPRPAAQSSTRHVGGGHRHSPASRTVTIRSASRVRGRPRAAGRFLEGVSRAASRRRRRTRRLSPPDGPACRAVRLLVRGRVDPDWRRRSRRVTATASPPGREPSANGRQHMTVAAAPTWTRQRVMCRCPTSE